MLGRAFHEIYKQDFHGLHAFRSSRPVVDTTTPRVPTLTDALTTDADIIATVRIGHNVWQKGLGFQTPFFYTPGRSLTAHPRVGHRRLGSEATSKFTNASSSSTTGTLEWSTIRAATLSGWPIGLSCAYRSHGHTSGTVATRDMHTTFMLTSRQFPGDASMVFPQPDTPTRRASRLPSFGGEGCAH